jgi:glycerol kinase
MAYQTRDVVEAMSVAAGRPVTGLRVDGGAAVNDLMLQLQADQLQAPVARSAATETTALGAAFLAGLAEGVWSSTDEVAACWRLEAEFRPRSPRSVADRRHGEWRRAVDHSRGWAEARE